MEIHYTIDLTTEAWVALVRHGYDPSLPPRGVAGPPRGIEGRVIAWDGGKPICLPLRNRVCELDGVEVDGHESSDLDPHGDCIHCGRAISPTWGPE